MHYTQDGVGLVDWPRNWAGPARPGVYTRTVTETPILSTYRIVGVRQNWYQAAPDAPKQPGGTCWFCGTGIANEVVIQDTKTDERHVIGTTCAERVGLSAAEVKALWDEKFANERRERSAEAQAERKAAEAAETALHGEHGSDTRYAAGCRCHLCVKAAPHGTVDRFRQKCNCLPCMDAGMTQDPDRYWIAEQYRVLVDMATGEIAALRPVSTKFGSAWKVGDKWINAGPKRRATIVNKGYTEAECPVLCMKADPNSDYSFHPLFPVGFPRVDTWGEPVPHPEVTA